MSNNKEQVIHQTKLFGIEFYKRTHLEEHEIQVIARQNITQYPGLLILGKDKYLRSPLSKPNPIWSMLAYSIIELTILDLIINGFIELNVLTDKKSYLNNFFKHESKSHRLIIKNEYLGDDNLAACIIKSVKSAAQDIPEKSNLKVVFRHLLYEYLEKNKRHSRPQKTFITALLHRYNRDYAWVKLNTHSGVFQSKLELDIPDQKRNELENSYKILHNILVTLKRESRAFYWYSDEFHRIINSEFQRQKPK